LAGPEKGQEKGQEKGGEKDCWRDYLMCDMLPELENVSA